jgi:hypothetical protein
MKRRKLRKMLDELAHQLHERLNHAHARITVLEDRADVARSVELAAVPFEGPFNRLVSVELCDVSATMCRRHLPPEPDDCPYEGHDHPRCMMPRGHEGRHDWQSEDDMRPTMDPHAPKPETYAIPGRPPTGRTVTDQHGVPWRIRADGWVERTDHLDDSYDWPEFLWRNGPATLVELTVDEAASEYLYGPIGSRWGNPDEPCPYADRERGCMLGANHAGPHRGEYGDILGADSIVDGPINTDPQQSAVEPCNCGRPDQHRPTCNRYRRMSHKPAPITDEEPF